MGYSLCIVANGLIFRILAVFCDLGINRLHGFFARESAGGNILGIFLVIL